MESKTKELSTCANAQPSLYSSQKYKTFISKCARIVKSSCFLAINRIHLEQVLEKCCSKKPNVHIKVKFSSESFQSSLMGRFRDTFSVKGITLNRERILQVRRQTMCGVVQRITDLLYCTDLWYPVFFLRSNKSNELHTLQCLQINSVCILKMNWGVRHLHCYCEIGLLLNQSQFIYSPQESEDS